jgi:hypothetical protein
MCIPMVMYECMARDGAKLIKTPQICASILGNEWSPVLSVISVCVTLQSMLASCKKKEMCACFTLPIAEILTLSSRLGPQTMIGRCIFGCPMCF